MNSPSKPLWPNVIPQIQHTPVSCGQTSVAMAIVTLTGKHLTDREINAKYGFELLSALNAETGPKYHWEDGGNLCSSSWAMIEHSCQNGMPVVVGLNGPLFSVTGRGHIVLIVKVEGDKVTFADPAHGNFRVVTKRDMEVCIPHPDGKFLFVCSKKTFEVKK